MTNACSSLSLAGIGAALPPQAVPNKQLEHVVNTTDQWIASRTGIAQRRILDGGPLYALALQAAKEALEDAGIAAGQVDYIIAATSQADDVFPSLAAMVQQPLGAQCPCADLHAACSGFLYALDMAQAYIQSGKARRVLVIAAEAMSRLVNWQDRSTCVLFGDGAAAVVVQAGRGLLSLRLGAQTNHALLHAPSPRGNCPFAQAYAPAPGIAMQGQEVFRFAVAQCADSLRQAAQDAEIALEKVDYLVLHQANRRILEAVRARLALDGARVPTNIHRLGNTSSASIPLLLYDLYHAGLLAPGTLLALGAFGAGLTWGAAVLRWDKPLPASRKEATELLQFGPYN